MLGDSPEDLLNAYRAQARPTPTSTGPAPSSGAEPLDYEGIAQGVDQQTAADQRAGANAAAKALSDAKRQMVQNLRQQRIPFQSDQNGNPAPIPGPDGGVLRQKFGSSNFISDKTGKIYRQNLQGPGFVEAPETSVGKDGKIRDAANRVVGTDPGFQKKKDDVDLLTDAHAALKEDYRSMMENPASVGAAKTALTSAQGAVSKLKQSQYDKSPDPDEQAKYQAAVDNATKAQKDFDDANAFVKRRNASSSAIDLLKDHMHMAKNGALPGEIAQGYRDMLSNRNVAARDDADYSGGSNDQGEAPGAQPTPGPAQPIPATAPAQPAEPTLATSGGSAQSTGAQAAASAKSQGENIQQPTDIPQAGTPAEAGAAPPPAMPIKPPAPVKPPLLVQPPPAVAAPTVPPPVATPDLIASLDTKSARDVLDQSAAGLQARGADLAQRQEAVSAPLTQADQNLTNLWSVNDASIANGDQASQKFKPDGTPLPPVADHLWDKIQDAYQAREKTRQSVQEALNTMQPDIEAHQADFADHQAATDAFNARVTSENEQEGRTQAQRDQLRASGMGAAADKLDALDAETEKGVAAINSRPGWSDEAKKAALDTFQKEQKSKFDTASTEIGKTRSAQISKAGQELYLNSKPSGNVEEPSDWDARDARRQAILDKYHLTPEQAASSEDDAKKMDFARPNAPQAITLSTGALAVNPELWGNKDAYEKAVNSSNATPEMKAKALDPDTFDTLHGRWLQQVTPEVMSMPGFDAWSDKMGKMDSFFPKWSDETKADAFLKSQTWTGRLASQIAGGAGRGLLEIARDAYGLAGGLSDVMMGKDYGLTDQAIAAGKLIAGSQRRADLRGESSTLLGLPGKAVEMGVNMAPAMLAGGIATKSAVPIADTMSAVQKIDAVQAYQRSAAVAESLPTIGANTTAAAFGAQSFGGTYASAVPMMQVHYEKAGMDPHTARMAAQNDAVAPALADALLTTTIFSAAGARGLASAFRNVTQTEGLLVKGFKEVMPDYFKQAGIEATKLGLNSLASGIVAKASYDPDRPPMDIVKEAFKSAGIGALFGLAGPLLHKSEQQHFITEKQAASGFDTQEDFNASMNHAAETGDVEKANYVRATNSKFYSKWARDTGAAGEHQDFKVAVGNGMTNEEYAAGKLGKEPEQATPQNGPPPAPPPSAGEVQGTEKPASVTPQGKAPDETAAPEEAQISPDAVRSASNTELARIGDTDPEAAQKADVLRRIATGEDIKTMPLADLRAVGLDRSSTGKITPAKGQAAPDVYMAQDAEGNMKPVITDAAISGLQQRFPATSSMIGMSEQERLAQISSPEKAGAAAQVPPRDVSPNAGGEPAESGGSQTAQGAGEATPAEPAPVPATPKKNVPHSEGKPKKTEQPAKTEPETPGSKPVSENVPQEPAKTKGEPAKTASDALKQWAASSLGEISSKKSQVRAAGLVKLASEALEPYGSMFDSFSVGKTSGDSGFEITPEGGLIIDPHALIRDMAKIGSVKQASQYVKDALDEEFRHKVSVMLEGRSEKFKANLNKVWGLLPENIKTLSAKAYFSAETGKFTDDWQAKHEFFRQFWQVAKIRRMTEMAFSDGAGRKSLRAMIDTYVAELQKLGGEVHPDLKGTLDELLAEAEAEAARLSKGEFTAAETPETQTPTNQANAPPTGKEPENREPEHQGASPGAAVSADQGKVRQGQGERPDSSNRPVGSAEENAPATVDTAAHEAATSPHNGLPEPTKSQKANGNYPKGHVKLAGLDISIENPAGSKRRPEWSALQDHYGYVKSRGEGADGDHHDVFVKSGTPLDWNGPVFVVNQNKADGSFDETKTVLGATDANDAHKVYQRNYEPGWKGYGSMAVFPDVAAYKEWLATGDMSKPAKTPKSKKTPASLKSEPPNSNEPVPQPRDQRQPAAEPPGQPGGEVAPVGEGENAPDAKTLKGAATSKSVRDHTQVAHIKDGNITITSKVGSKTAQKFTFPVSEWADAFKHPNPNYSRREVINKYTAHLNDEPGGDAQAERIKDAMVDAINKAFVDSGVHPLALLKKPIPADGEKIDTIAGKLSFTEFEKKGYAPEQVTKTDWVNLMRSERRRLGQQEGGDNKNAPWSEYEAYHEDAVKAALKKGETVDPQVLEDYPNFSKPKSEQNEAERQRLIAKEKTGEKAVPDYTEELREDLGVSRASLDAYDPQKAVSKVGKKWSFKTLQGNEHPGMFDTRKEAIASAASHKELKEAQFQNPAAYRNIHAAKSHKRSGLITKYMQQGMSEMEAGKQARIDVPDVVEPAAEVTPALAKEEAKPEPLKQRTPFNPKVAQEQKKYLLDAMDKAIEDAPSREDLHEWPDSDAIAQAEKDHSYTYNLANKEKQKAAAEQLQPLFEKYGVPLERDAEGNPVALPTQVGKLYEASGAARNAAMKEKYPPFVTIEVPGDGTFTLANTEESLKDFAKRAKGFPTTRGTPSGPAGVGPVPKPTKITPLPPKEPSNADILKIAGTFTSEDETRFVLQHMMSTGSELVATNGKMLLRMEGKYGGSEEKPMFYTATGKQVAEKDREDVGNYPPFRQVLNRAEEPLIHPGIDTGRLQLLLKQAAALFKDSGNPNDPAATLYTNADGTIGVAAEDPQNGSYEHNVTPESTPVGHFNIKYLDTALGAARSLGHEKVKVERLKNPDETSKNPDPIALVAGNMEAVVMPIRSGAKPASAAETPASEPTAQNQPPPSEPEAANQPPTPEPAATLKTQADTSFAGKTPQELLAAAEPYRQHGTDYNRNIAESAARLKQVLDRGETKFAQIAADELAVRLDRWGQKAPAVSSATQPSAASRFKPRERVTFPKPFVGPSGTKLTAYEWANRLEDGVDKRGEDIVQRVSDWEQAVGSDETGRAIVHMFDIETPNGEHRTMSLESALEALGYADKSEGAAKISSLASTLKTRARSQMKLDAYREAKEIYDAEMKSAQGAVEKLPLPAIESAKAFVNAPESKSQRFSMGDAWVIQHAPGPIENERWELLVGGWKSKRAWDLLPDDIKAIKTGGAYPPAWNTIPDLEQRIKKLDAKIRQISEQQTEAPPAPAPTKAEENEATRARLLAEGKTRVKPKKLTAKNTLEALRKYFTPGAVVDSYGGKDRVISFSGTDLGNWRVKVQGLDEKGNDKPDDVRTHATQPSREKLEAALNTIQTKETEKGVALHNNPPYVTPSHEQNPDPTAGTIPGYAQAKDEAERIAHIERFVRERYGRRTSERHGAVGPPLHSVEIGTGAVGQVLAGKVAFDEGGDLTLHIRVGDEAIKFINDTSEAALAWLVDDVVGEELAHLSDVGAIRGAWKSARGTGNFRDHLARQNAAFLVGMSDAYDAGGGDVKMAIDEAVDASRSLYNYPQRSIYGLQGLADELRSLNDRAALSAAAGEFVRMIVQLENFGRITETGWRQVQQHEMPMVQWALGALKTASEMIHAGKFGEAVKQRVEQASANLSKFAKPEGLHAAPIPPDSGESKPDDLESALESSDYEPTPEDIKAWQDSQRDADAGTPRYVPGTTVPEMPEGSVGTRNAYTDWQRQIRDLPARMKSAAREFGTVWEDAQAQIAHNSNLGSEIIDEINEKPRALSDTERAVLTHEFLTRSQNQDNAARAVNDSVTDEDRTKNRLSLARARDAYYEAMQAAARTGTESGRSLNAIRMALMEDFSLARLEALSRAAIGGKWKSDEERDRILADVKRYQEQIAGAMEALDKAEAEIANRYTKEQAEAMIAEREAQPKVIIRYRTKRPTLETDVRAMKAQRLEQWRKMGLSAPVPPDVDAAYKKAVESGDMESAQRMVDEAAKKAGYDSQDVWHGTRSRDPITEFRPSREGSEDAIFFSDNKDQAIQFPYPAGATSSVRVRLKGDLLDVNANGELYVPEVMERWIRKARESGKDGLHVRNIQNFENGERSDTYAIFDPSQIKSADPITRDASGKVIPLSERFNPESKSILHAPKPPVRFNILADIGYANYALGAQDFDSWLDSMKADGLGDAVADQAGALYEESKARHQKAFSATIRRNAKIQTVAGMTDELRTGGINPAGVRALAMAVVKEGERNPGEVVRRVHEQLKEIDPGITEREVADAISGYGTPVQQETDEDKKAFRDITSQLQLLSKIEDAEHGTPPLRMRPPGHPSEAVRRLTADLQEALKRNHIVVTDPETQLKTQQEAIYTRLKNRKEDLERQIAAGKRDPHSPSKIEYTAELKGLQDEVKALNESLDAIDPRKTGLSPEARVKAATKAVERSIADLNRRIKEHDISPKAKTAPVTTPDLTKLREERDELRERLDAMRDAANPKMTDEERALKQLKRRTTNSIAEYKRREAEAKKTGKPYYPEKKKPLNVRDDELDKLRANALEAKKAYYRFNNDLERKQRSLPLKAADFAAAYKRWSVISRVGTLGKLFLAANARHITTPVEDAISAGLAHTPGFRWIGRHSPRHFAGYSVTNEARFVAQGFVGFVKHFGQRWLTGNAPWETALEKHKVNEFVGEGTGWIFSHPIGDYIGHLHMIMKSPAVEAEFVRSFTRNAAYYARFGIDISLPEAQIRIANATTRELYDKAMQDAKEDSERTKLMQASMIHDAWKGALRAFDSKRWAGRGGPYLAATMRWLIPILKVPVNYATETFHYTPVGLAATTTEAAARRFSQYRKQRRLQTQTGGGGEPPPGAGELGVMLSREFEKLPNELPPEVANSILRRLAKGIVGAGVLMLLGYLNPNTFGGYYEEREKRKKGDVKAGGIRIGSWDVPRWMTHIPIIEAIQFGATIRRVHDNILHEKARKGLTDHAAGVKEGLKNGFYGIFDDAGDSLEALYGGAKSAYRGLAEHIPFIDFFKRSQTEGQMLRDAVVPGVVQEAAQAMDTRNGEPIKRDPRGNGLLETTKNEVKLGIPGMRKDVREKGGPFDELGYPKGEKHQGGALEKMIDGNATYKDKQGEAHDVHLPQVGGKVLDGLKDQDARDRFSARVAELTRGFARDGIETPDKLRNLGSAKSPNYVPMASNPRVLPLSTYEGEHPKENTQTKIESYHAEALKRAKAEMRGSFRQPVTTP